MIFNYCKYTYVIRDWKFEIFGNCIARYFVVRDQTFN